MGFSQEYTFPPSKSDCDPFLDSKTSVSDTHLLDHFLHFWCAPIYNVCKRKIEVEFFLPSLVMRGSTQREALATRSIEKNLELTFPIVTPPILVPKWPYWWGLSNGASFDQIWYYYDGANKDLVPKKARKQQIFGVVKLDTQCLVPFCNTIQIG